MLSVLAAHKIRKIVMQIARAARVAALIACQRWMIRDCASSRLHELLAVWLCLMSPDAFDPQARSRPTYDIVSPLKSLYWHFLSRFGLRHENRSFPFGGTLNNRNLIYGHRASDVVQQKSFKSGIIICRFQCLKKKLKNLIILFDHHRILTFEVWICFTLKHFKLQTNLVEANNYIQDHGLNHSNRWFLWRHNQPQSEHWLENV